ncbi:alpha/beta hydrolase [Brevibacillus ruminantium]|uniref:Alpha/beta hydrolase n=1 Tax=Brevibacillus ruminantium TaxID=2950604 RepID=A0ABY4WE12_9BACL|nr:alpha/beta hydrolase [Brevibacillus ruminantium]USG64157.1 alpha/beta hydrolase [Brevibacillus ruminantium]
MKTKTVANDVEIAYLDSGAGEAVCLVHGFCGSSAYWQKILPQLEKSHRVIAPDLRGHGNSSVPSESFTVEKMAGDLAHLLDQTGIEKITLLGHSLGGYVALAFAELFPERVKAIGLIHSTAYPDDEQAKANRTKGMDNIQRNGVEPFIKALIPKLFAPESATLIPAEWNLAREIGLQTPAEGAIRTLEAMRDRPDRREILASLPCPLLLVAGKNDQIIAPEKTFTVKGPRVHQVLLEGAGHMGMLETPDELAQEMLSFLSKI